MKRALVGRANAAVNARVKRTRSAAGASLWTLALVAALAIPLLALTPADALAISRDAVLARAQSWVDSPVRYSQRKRHLGYRTDCSGYVSMCWKTKTSWSTRSFKSVTRRIAVSQLKPGDAMLKKGYHVRLFYGWIDEAHTQYVAYEAGSSLVGVCRIHSIAEDLRVGYVPTRYRRITDSPASANLLQNGSFDSWSKSWGAQGDQPVWWQAKGSPWQLVTAQRKDTYRTARSSLTLINSGGARQADTDLSQSVPVVAGATYRLSAWAAMATDPHHVELHLEYLDAAGRSVARTAVTGAQAGVEGPVFRGMAVQLAVPPDAVRALVTVRLASVDASGAADGAPQNSSVTLDDLSLVRQ
jgi:hypothetical protein